MAEEVDQFSEDENTRVVALVYGYRPDQTRFWIYVAVIPSKFDEFVAQQKANTLDLYHLEIYGEIITYGNGDVPPADITQQVAERYKLDPSKLFQQVDPKREIAEKMSLLDTLKKKLKTS